MKHKELELNTIKPFDYQEIRNYILSTSNESKVYVGCDSKDHKTHVDFVTVVCIHVDCRHGTKIFYEKRRIKKRIYLHDRLWQEVILSGETAMEIAPFVGKRGLEVHLDLNPNRKYKSNSILKDALAYVQSLGFDVKEKPEAHSASYAADHYLRV